MDWSELYFSCHGRLSRRRYWLASLPLIAAQILAEILIGSKVGPTIGALVYLAIIVPSFVITIKRLHDRGRSGWFAATVAIPLAGAIWLLIEAGVLPGVRGANRYGPDPLEELAVGSATSASAPV